MRQFKLSLCFRSPQSPLCTNELEKPQRVMTQRVMTQRVMTQRIDEISI